jgi:hypothetical protein
MPAPARDRALWAARYDEVDDALAEYDAIEAALAPRWARWPVTPAER